ncbi:formimidoylglutamase [Labilibaculum antarcticum]|uniref:Formimidoylglutamase n=1 Tax=Labilibaculum antarcticum TaxID=1717717 RepID=A0A1Y1CMN4_9BACT|nr:formimidoylglutamase [Labilibaculum antarcticum]BAX81222.1 formimidoylglutamase [Labilibaculum antarcticum]
MERRETESINAEYRPAEKGHWEGRKSNPDIGKQYWHQQIEFVDWNDLPKHAADLPKIDIALLGYVCDEGVRRNRGRMGAHEGPKVIRDRLAKLPIHFESKRVIDAGNIVCIDDDMEACQDLFSNAISDLLKQNIFPIAIGGGHDMSYAHFMGIKNAILDSPKQRIGIINFDAHFDLRPVETKGNSGTPFNQILSECHEKGDQVDYYAIGIQQQSNTRELFDVAKKENVNYSINYDCESSAMEMESLKQKLAPIIANNDYLYITIDMDGFSSAYAPGVSAPSPLGFTPYFVFKLLSFLFVTKKVIAFDIAELNPSLDRDMHTASLAAKIVDFVVINYESSI